MTVYLQRVLMLGGEFQLDSESGKGTVVIVRVPARPAQEEEPEEVIDSDFSSDRHPA